MMRTLFFLAACCLWTAAQASTIYKCSDGGRTVYRERPCSGAGAALDLPPAPAPDPHFEARQQRAHAMAADIDARNARDAVLADREAREAFARRQHVEQDQRRRCAQMRIRHREQQIADDRRLDRAQGRPREWARQDAADNARRRAAEFKTECAT